MNEPGDSKQSKEKVMVEATGLLTLGVAPSLPSSLKVIGHDRVMLDHDVGRSETACGAGTVESGIPAYGWGVGWRGMSRDQG